MAKLTDLRVQRVDAVDRPATGRRFLLTKAADGMGVGDGAGAPDAADTALAAAVQACIAAFQGAQLTSDQAQALDGLMAAVQADNQADVQAMKSEDAQPAVADTAALAAAVGAEVAKALAPITEQFASLQKSLTPTTGQLLQKGWQPAVAVTSRQPKEADAKPVAKSMGEGLFTDVVFGSN